MGSHNPSSFGAQCSRWHSFPSPIDMGHSNPPHSGPNVLAGTPPRVNPPSELSLPRWQIAECLTLIPFVTAQAYRYEILSSIGFPFGLPLKVFKTCLLEEVSTLYYFVLLSNRYRISHEQNPLWSSSIFCISPINFSMITNTHYFKS